MTCIKLTKEKSDKLSQKFTNQDLIRSGIIAELDTISLYQSQIENTNDEESKKVLTHIMDEEKEHVAELSCILMKQDSTQKRYLEKFLKITNVEKLECSNHNNNKDTVK